MGGKSIPVEIGACQGKGRVLINKGIGPGLLGKASFTATYGR
jgi:hypothetical protein